MFEMIYFIFLIRLKRTTYVSDRFEIIELLISDKWDILLHPLNQANVSGYQSKVLKYKIANLFTRFVCCL